MLYGGGAAGSIAQRVSDNIAIDRRLNAVLVSGPPDVVAAYKAFIEKIDVPLGSVMLETQIVELTDTAARDLGIDFTNAAGQLASATYQSKSLQSAQGSVSLQAAVYAEVQRGNGRLIAQPRILALDGTPASIITGDALPIVTSIAVSGVNAVQQQVQYVNVGVNLQIQPRISFDGYVTAHVFSAVSSVTGYSQSYPQISQRQASTLATVKDGDSFVIGGLLEKSEIDSLAKIPGIGDIPIIGGFFRVRHRSMSTTNLYIIVTPHVVSYGEPGTGPQSPPAQGAPIPHSQATPAPPPQHPPDPLAPPPFP
jgi:general secretion pathway protein D